MILNVGSFNEMSSNASFKDQLAALIPQVAQNKEIKPSKNRVGQRNHNNNNNKEKKIKPKWLDYAQYGVALLKAYFPGAFNEVKPLKKGIKQDLVKQLSTMSNIVIEDKACMVKSLSYYVNTMSYHKSITEGSVRIDLDGQGAGQVMPEEAKYSAERFQAKLQTKKHLRSSSEE
jgi:ProP effector